MRLTPNLCTSALPQRWSNENTWKKTECSAPPRPLFGEHDASLSSPASMHGTFLIRIYKSINMFTSSRAARRPQGCVPARAEAEAVEGSAWLFPGPPSPRVGRWCGDVGV